MQIRITPIGDIDTTVIGEVANVLRKQYDVTIEVNDEVPYSALELNSRATPYHAEQILRLVTASDLPEPSVLLTRLPITHADREFVFGIADAERSACLVSTYLLFQSTEDSTFPDPMTALSRVRKEVAHEIGHVFGRSHCGNSRCVMHFSMGLAEVDAKSELLCKDCASKSTQENSKR